MEEYIITNGCHYIAMSATGKVKKTSEVLSAKRFALEADAQKVINSCTKKCKG